MTAHRILTERVDVDVPDAPPMGAYLARPAAAGRFPGVVVAMELFGVSAHVRDVCERLAALGYRALAPDYHHRTASGIELPEDSAGRNRGFALLQQMTRPQAIADTRAAIEHLCADGDARVGMVGLSLGGHIAYLAASELDLAAVVVAYAGWIPTTDIPLSRPEPTLTQTSAITGNLLMLVGEHDHVVAPEHRRAIAAALHDAGTQHEIVEYPGALHGFLNDRRESFDPRSAADAWQRIQRLFAQELSPAH